MPEDGVEDDSETTQVDLEGRRHHPDERTRLAYAYKDHSLAAVGYTPEIVDHWERATDYDVIPTPEGEQYV